MPVDVLCINRGHIHDTDNFFIISIGCGLFSQFKSQSFSCKSRSRCNYTKAVDMLSFFPVLHYLFLYFLTPSSFPLIHFLFIFLFILYWIFLSFLFHLLLSMTLTLFPVRLSCAPSDFSLIAININYVLIFIEFSPNSMKPKLKSTVFLLMKRMYHHIDVQYFCITWSFSLQQARQQWRQLNHFKPRTDDGVRGRS
jgi:hypothetical protein